ncbi:MAG: hypothetical protein P8Z40_16740 [Chloroflexota bacterium]
MSTTLIKSGSIGLLILFTLASGLLLRRMGRPHNVLISTVHKLVALGALVLLILTAFQVNRAAGLGGLQMAVVAAAVLFFLGAIAGGGWLMIVEGPAPPIARRLHQILPVLTVLSSAGSLALLLGVGV